MNAASIPSETVLTPPVDDATLVPFCRRTVSAVHPGWWRTEWLDEEGQSLGIVSYRKKRSVRQPAKFSWRRALAAFLSSTLDSVIGSLTWRSSTN